MKFYVVCPGSLLTALPLDWNNHVVLSNYAMNDIQYAAYFAARRQHDVNDFVRNRMHIIMDNPVHERLPIPSSLHREYGAKRIGAQVLVAPDKIGDPNESLTMLREHMRLPLANDYGTLAVVQGKTAEEYDEYIRVLPRFVSYIGVPQIRSGIDFSRTDFILSLADSGFFDMNPHVRIHLLGNIGLFQDARAISGYGVHQVTGIDSAKPIYLGALGIDILDTEKALAVRRPKDFFSEAFAQNVPTENFELIRHNIAVVQEWIDGR